MRDRFVEDYYPPTPCAPKPRFISPPKSELGNLRTPLTDGEKLVLEFFDKHLPPEWEIYIQPHLNGLCPDFVLLNPNVGIAVFEVKDWDLDAVRYEMVPRGDRSPELVGIRDGKRFSHQRNNPVEKVIRYKKEITELYCPRLNKNNGYAAITAGVIFPFADDARVFRLFEANWRYLKMDEKPAYYPISGRNALQAGDLLRVFPEARRPSSIVMTPELADDFRSWLVEADAAKEQRIPLPLDKKQRRLAEDRTSSGYRRIKGPAGSGKSIVLAARAANLIAQDKSILVVAFNITLLNYLADSAVRNNHSARKKGTWLHFHRWCKRVCEEVGRTDDYAALFKGNDGDEEASVPDRQLCQLVGEILDNADEEVTRYDAILVDEGQDMQPEWWNILRKVLKPGGEMVLVADTTQDVYGRAVLWTEAAMTGAGFTGEWAKLEESYRMPPKLTELVRSFGERFLPMDNRNLPPSPQMELGELWPCQLRWVSVSSDQAAMGCFAEYIRLMSEHGGKELAVSDVTVLADTRELGEAIVKQFNQRGMNCLNTFAADKREQRIQKLGFHKGSEKIKATTLHSFKGWESRAILLCLGQQMDQRSLALVYAGLTRLKREAAGSFLTVICADPGLADYGKTWPEFENLTQHTYQQDFGRSPDAGWGIQTQGQRWNDVPLPPEPWEDSPVAGHWEELVPQTAEETFGLKGGVSTRPLPSIPPLTIRPPSNRKNRTNRFQEPDSLSPFEEADY